MHRPEYVSWKETHKNSLGFLKCKQFNQSWPDDRALL